MPTPKLILASGSPRRKMLLHMSGFDIADVCPPDVPEVRDPSESPIGYCRRLSSDKAAAVPAHGAWVLAADTIVHCGDQIFEKPDDDDDAQRMLSELSGQWHQVTSAWYLRWSGPGPSPAAPRRMIRGHRTSRVRFRSLSPVEIQRYVQTGEGRDKAGAYALQGDGSALIERVVGSTTNVVGLPMDMLKPILLAVGIPAGALS
jgi:septum formation protein